MEVYLEQTPRLVVQEKYGKVQFVQKYLYGLKYLLEPNLWGFAFVIKEFGLCHS